MCRLLAHILIRVRSSCLRCSAGSAARWRRNWWQRGGRGATGPPPCGRRLPLSAPSRASGSSRCPPREQPLDACRSCARLEQPRDELLRNCMQICSRHSQTTQSALPSSSGSRTCGYNPPRGGTSSAPSKPPIQLNARLPRTFAAGQRRQQDAAVKLGSRDRYSPNTLNVVSRRRATWPAGAPAGPGRSCNQEHSTMLDDKLLSCR